jgi:hypothetical protein
VRKYDELIQALRELHFCSDANRKFEMLSGGFLWSDERPKRYSDAASGYPFRCLIGYRASMILEKPREEHRVVWDSVLAGCPGWPGFRAERCDPALADELRMESAGSMREFEKIDDVFERAARMRKNLGKETGD